MPVFRYQTQVTIHGRLPDFNPETRPGGSAPPKRPAMAAASLSHCAGLRSRFLPGETGASYRRRLVEGFKAHSSAWKPVDLVTLADAAFEVAESQIYADAATAAKNATGVEDGGLRMVPGRTASGHQKVEFFGRTGTLLSRFSGVRRYATSIRPNTNKSEVA